MLRFDYNIAYKGSITSKEEKRESRKRLLATVTETLELLALFVQDNNSNQELILPSIELVFSLRNAYTAPVPHNPEEEDELKDPTDAPEEEEKDEEEEAEREEGNMRHIINTEMLLAELVRGNLDACRRVQGHFLRDLGRSLHDYHTTLLGDMSLSPILDFFVVVCCPRDQVTDLTASLNPYSDSNPPPNPHPNPHPTPNPMPNPHAQPSPLAPHPSPLTLSPFSEHQGEPERPHENPVVDRARPQPAPADVHRLQLAPRFEASHGGGQRDPSPKHVRPLVGPQPRDVPEVSVWQPVSPS